MCECKAATPPDTQLHPETLPQGEFWEYRCQAIIGTGVGSAPIACPTTTVGGLAGLHAHHLTVHVGTSWPYVSAHS